MISRPSFFAAQGACVGVCVQCGKFASCTLTCNKAGDTFLFCKECAGEANIRGDPVSLSSLMDRYNGGRIPDNF